MTTFTHAGVSTLNGECKVRFANDATRVKILAKNGHKDIDIIQLKEAMSKEDAIAFLISIDFDNGNAVVRAALEDAVDRRTVQSGNKDRPKKEAKKPKKTAPVAPSMAAIEAKVAAAKATPQVPAINGTTNAAPKSTKTRAEVLAQLDSIEDAPF